MSFCFVGWIRAIVNFIRDLEFEFNTRHATILNFFKEEFDTHHVLLDLRDWSLLLRKDDTRFLQKKNYQWFLKKNLQCRARTNYIGQIRSQTNWICAFYKPSQFNWRLCIFICLSVKLELYVMQCGHVPPFKILNCSIMLYCTTLAIHFQPTIFLHTNISTSSI